VTKSGERGNVHVTLNYDVTECKPQSQQNQFPSGRTQKLIDRNQLSLLVVEEPNSNANRQNRKYGLKNQFPILSDKGEGETPVSEKF
jgi:hypothetical protein